MRRPLVTFARNTLLLSWALLSEVAYGQFKTVDVTDPRPVGKAVQVLESIYGRPITYEDPITVNPNLLADITEEVQLTPGPSHRVIGQKRMTLSFSYRPPDLESPHSDNPGQAKQDLDSAMAEALSNLIESYSASGGSVKFYVTKAEGIFHVIPANFVNVEGKLEPVTPILDTKITILPKERTRLELFLDICQALTNATGIRVAEGVFPGNGLRAELQTTVSGTDVTARSILNQLLAELAAPISRDVVVDTADGQKVTQNQVVLEPAAFSWKLFYSPGWGYALNVHAVTLGSK
jgi:hypothetical protein